MRKIKGGRFFGTQCREKSAHLSLQAPFHSHSLPHGLRARTNSTVLVPLFVCMSICYSSTQPTANAATTTGNDHRRSKGKCGYSSAPWGQKDQTDLLSLRVLNPAFIRAFYIKNALEYTFAKLKKSLKNFLRMGL